MVKVFYMNYLFIALCCIFLSFGHTVFSYENIEIIPHPIQSKERYDLMKTYANQHYGLNHANLIDPKMIVVHFTGISSLQASLRTFDPARIPPHRQSLEAYGDVNVGVHFLIDYDGTIYSLLPLHLMGRHTIGYNYTAIGIENVGSELTIKQSKATVHLIRYLVDRLPSIEFLIGHMEYMNQTYPHFELYTALDKDYEPNIKIDPGFETMKGIRLQLEKKYKIFLKK